MSMNTTSQTSLIRPNWFSKMALHGSCDTVSSNSLWDDPIKIEMIDDTDEKIKIDQLMYLALADVSTSSGEAGSCIPEVGTGFTGRESPSSFLGFKGNTFKNASGLFYDSPKQPDQKLQIRHDCMWAGTCGDLSHPDKHSAVGCGGCNRHLQQLHQSTVSLMFSSAKSLVKTVKAGEPLIGAGEIGRTAGGNRPQPASHPFPTAVKSATFKAVQSSAELPAGSSLLKRQNQLSVMPSQQYKQLPLSPPSSSDSCASSSESVSEGRGHDQRMVLRVPHVSRGSFLAASEQELRSITAQNHARPDTPLSLEDGHPEFKHNNLNILTCTVGSNQQSLLHSSYTSSSTAATGSAGVSSSVNGNITNSATINSTFGGNTSCSSGVTLGGGECRTTAGGYDNRLGGNCSCGGSISSASSIGGVNCHTTQCYYNYLQDDTIPSEEDLRHRIMMIDDPNSLSDLPNHHQHQHNHDVLRSESPSTESVRLRQLLNDLHEIERSSPSRSFLLDDQHASPSACGILAKDGSSQLSIHPHHQQQQAQQQQQGLRNNHSTLAPCGGGMSGGAHIACSKECCWSSLELSHHHLAFPANERKRRHQFDYRRRNITTRGLISDDDEDEEDDLLRQLVEDEDDFDKHLEQFALDYHSNTPLSEDEEDEEEDEEEEEDDEESEEEEEEKKHRMEDEDEEEDENEEEEDEDVQNEKSMYGSSSGRSRSRNRTSRHRYHNQYHQHRRTAARASYRSYEGDAAYGNGKASKMPATNLLGNGTVNTIIAGSGASSLKPSLLGSKAGNGSSLSSAGTATSTGLTQQSAGTNNNSYQATHFGDHSYTRPKGGYNMNELGVQTPSDSDEEIDVVSVGDKNLPTNPTERDYRHLQSEVASKIRTASSRGTTNGSLPYGSGSHHHHHYQRQHQLADGTRQGHLGGIYPTPASSTTISGANTPLPTRSGGASAASSPPPACSTSSGSASRKRSVGGSGSSSKRSSNASKRMRLGHSKRGGDGGRYDTCGQSLAEELDTVEKRNLHNNLERQRRIGLKNLFEELKRQIPQLRDKDRAPKVNILREAASLCTRLNQEAEQVNELRQQQMKLYERLRYLRASMHSQRVGLE